MAKLFFFDRFSALLCRTFTINMKTNLLGILVIPTLLFHLDNKSLIVSEICFRATSGRMASCREKPSGLMHLTSEKPACNSASLSLMRPAMRHTGTSPDCRSTPTGNLPMSVWLSADPSPVMTRSASLTTSLKRAASSSTSIPGLQVACMY